MKIRALTILVTALLSLLNAQTQLSVTFRYVNTPEDNFVRVFVPGEMNNWGPNSSGFISPTASSLMQLNETVDSYIKNYSNRKQSVKKFLNFSKGENMSSQEKLVTEFNDSVEHDLNKRKRSIED